MTVIGFTGSQLGSTPEQRAVLWQLLEGATEFHHGDCIGADAEAHQVAVRRGIPVVVHPPVNESKRAWCTDGDVTVLPPLPYLVRNHSISDTCDTIVAAPSGPEVLRSGTWATVRYARKTGTPVIVIAPDGTVS